MKVSLLLCPQWDPHYALYSFAAFSAALKARGHEVSIFDLNHTVHRMNLAAGRDNRPQLILNNRWADPRFVEEEFLPTYRGYLENFTDRVLAGGARAAGFSIYYSNQAVSLAVARMLKRKDPGLKIVFGGPSCLIFRNCLELIREDAVDAVVFGEADRAFPDLVDALDRGRRPGGPGILLRDDPATWKEEQDAVLELDSLPYADFSGFELSNYSGKTIHSCRGCVRRCVFCSDWRQKK
ncbi:MAG: B12-binding domain-containing radical SAM protein, partial [Elusimicrobiota bacterium]